MTRARRTARTSNRASKERDEFAVADRVTCVRSRGSAAVVPSERPTRQRSGGGARPEVLRVHSCHATSRGARNGVDLGALSLKYLRRWISVLSSDAASPASIALVAPGVPAADRWTRATSVRVRGNADAQAVAGDRSAISGHLEALLARKATTAVRCEPARADASLRGRKQRLSAGARVDIAYRAARTNPQHRWRGTATDGATARYNPRALAATSDGRRGTAGRGREPRCDRPGPRDAQCSSRAQRRWGGGARRRSDASSFRGAGSHCALECSDCAARTRSCVDLARATEIEPRTHCSNCARARRRRRAPEVSRSRALGLPLRCISPKRGGILAR
jgi:hypothetical protein